LRLGCFAERGGKPVIVDMGGAAALVADQKDAIMPAGRVGVGQIGIGAFDPERQIGRYEQVENAINAVRGDPPAFGLRDGFGNVIGRGWLGKAGKRVEHRRAHRGPLFS